jgi:hypothetical protein
MADREEKLKQIEKIEYSENKEGGKKKEYKKKYNKKENREKREREIYTRKKEEIVNEVDSDGFEIVGTKEKKKEQQREEYRKERKKKNLEKK